MSRDSDLVWIGPVFDPSGYADEGRGFLCALDRLGVPVTLRPVRRHVPGFREGLPSAERTILDRQIARALPARSLLVQHHTADGFSQLPGDVYHIGRTMYETDGIPPSWVTHCNRMDELWLPSHFNRETFQRAGVTVPVVLVPGGIDSTTYRPEGPVLPVEGLRGTVFLSVFEWRIGKGWDVLLRAWADAFRPDDDVTLVLRTYPLGRVAGQDNAAIINARIDAFLREACGRSREDVAPIVVLGKPIAAEDMPALYRIASALVAPTRGEGWGRPFMEAMATGVPVIATNWSAQLEFMHDENSLLIDIDGLEEADGVEIALYAGQRWASPSVSHLVTRLRQVHEDRAAARALGARARTEMVECWPWRRAAEVMAARVTQLTEERAARDATPRHAARLTSGPTLAIDATLFDPASSSTERERVVASLVHAWPGALRVTTRASGTQRPSWSCETIAAWQALPQATGTNDRPLPERTAPPDVALTWLDTARSPAPVRPAAAHWVLHTGEVVGRTVPGAFVRTLRDHADEVWVPDATAHAACLAAGIDPERLWLVPTVPGSAHVTPAGAVHPVASRTGASRADTVFLLPVHEPAQLSAADALLRAWPRAFTAHDAVRLVLHMPDTPDRTMTAWRERVRMQLASGRLLIGAPVELLHQQLPADELAALVRAAPVLLDPVASASLRAERRLAEQLGQVVLTGAAPNDAVPAGHVRVSLTAQGTIDAAAWVEAMRAAADPSWRHRHGVASCDASPTMSEIASAATARLEARHRTPRRDASLAIDGVAPWPLDDARGTTVLAAVDWASGEGGGVVRSYIAACDARDDVSLVLCLDPAQGVSVDDVVAVVREAMTAAGRTDGDVAEIVLVPDLITDALRRALLARCDAVVALDATPLGAAARAAGKVVLTSLAPAQWRGLAKARVAA